MGIINMVPFPAFKPEPPVVVITTADNQYVDSAVFGIAGTASDPNDDIVSVAYDVSGDGDSGACAGTTSWSATTDLGSVGTKTVTVTATDARSLTGDDSITVNYIDIVIDIAAPAESPGGVYRFPLSSNYQTTITGSSSVNLGSISGVAYALSGATSGSGACSGTTSWSTGVLDFNFGRTTATIEASSSGLSDDNYIYIDRPLSIEYNGHSDWGSSPTSYHLLYGTVHNPGTALKYYWGLDSDGDPTSTPDIYNADASVALNDIYGHGPALFVPSAGRRVWAEVVNHPYDGQWYYFRLKVTYIGVTTGPWAVAAFRTWPL